MMDSMSIVLSSSWGVCAATAAAGLLGYVLLRPRKKIGGDCCPAGAEPLLLMAGYSPTGETVTIGKESLQCYVAWPKPNKANGRAVFVFQDVFGIHTGRHKQFCDMLAEQGYGVVAPDFTGKDAIVKNPPQYGCTFCCLLGMVGGVCCGGFSRKTKKLSWGNAMGSMILETVVPDLHMRGATKIASVGFCWGSYGAICCGQSPQLFCCNAAFHPSTEGICKGNGEDDLALCHAAQVPQLVVATGMESARWKPGGAAQQACGELEHSFRIYASHAHARICCCSI
jgi:dienelactone hydrolase